MRRSALQTSSKETCPVIVHRDEEVIAARWRLQWTGSNPSVRIGPGWVHPGPAQQPDLV